MKTIEAFSEASVYVGTYAKYAGGSIEGAWLDISDYESKADFIEACRKLHEDEDEPEFMFQGWEHIPSDLISENYISSLIFKLKSILLADEEDPFITWVGEYSDWDNLWGNIDKSVETFREQYCGEWDSEEDYAEELFNEFYAYEIPTHLRCYIDYEAFARDLFMDGYKYIGGYVFRFC